MCASLACANVCALLWGDIPLQVGSEAAVWAVVPAFWATNLSPCAMLLLLAERSGLPNLPHLQLFCSLLQTAIAAPPTTHEQWCAPDWPRLPHTPTMLITRAQMIGWIAEQSVPLFAICAMWWRSLLAALSGPQSDSST